MKVFLTVLGRESDIKLHDVSELQYIKMIDIIKSSDYIDVTGETQGLLTTFKIKCDSITCIASVK